MHHLPDDSHETILMKCQDLFSLKNGLALKGLNFLGFVFIISLGFEILPLLTFKKKPKKYCFAFINSFERKNNRCTFSYTLIIMQCVIWKLTCNSANIF